MNKKTLKRQRDLKTKLMAAISMLLVSSLMMVTSTYAWFTLSTAPEVTGITTAVGANGNLEMALLNPTLQDADGNLIAQWGDAIVSSTSDSMDAAGKLISEANITWGNLVDLKDNNSYGLNNIMLYPSKLATVVEGETTKVSDTPLSRPVFGADGRIAELKADTLTASFASGTFSNEGAFGVRAVGTASSMTAREMAHRAALASAATASTNAKSAASNALKANGNRLAGIAITHVGDATAKFSYVEVDALRIVVNALKKSHEYIEEAMNWYVVAHNIAPEEQNDSTYLALQTKIQGMTLEQIKADETISKPAGFDEAYVKLNESKKRVTDALAVLDPILTEDAKTRIDIGWDEFDDALTYIMSFNNLKLNGLTMDEVTQKDEEGNYENMGVIVNAMGKGGLKLQMPTGSGVFADIADFCGTYSATITFANGTNVMGVPIAGVEATMTTDQPVSPLWLTAIRTNANPFATAAGGEATKSITDFYGYIVDLAFRTNASGSSLLLQADAIDRIYGEDGNNEDTMGHGSSMTFTASEEFGVPKVQALMTNLRIVFFDTETNAIISEARLDLESAEVEGSAVTMKMGMWDSVAKAFKSGENANAIVELAQNEAKAISVLVYLDGESVTNADVATSGSASMVGTMNLQFASSATLIPMEYADLKDGKSDATATTIKLNNVTVDTATAEKGISVIQAQAMSISELGNGFGVILSGVPANGVVTATIGDQVLTAHEVAVAGMQGYAFAYEGITADTAVVITVTEPTAGE